MIINLGEVLDATHSWLITRELSGKQDTTLWDHSLGGLLNSLLGNLFGGLLDGLSGNFLGGSLGNDLLGDSLSNLGDDLLGLSGLRGDGLSLRGDSLGGFSNGSFSHFKDFWVFFFLEDLMFLLF